jgi:hypothetical protein
MKKIFKDISPTVDAPEIQDASFLNVSAIVESFTTHENFVGRQNFNRVNRNPYNIIKKLLLKRKLLAKQKLQSTLQNQYGDGNGNIYGPIYFLVAQSKYPITIQSVTTNASYSDLAKSFDNLADKSTIDYALQRIKENNVSSSEKAKLISKIQAILNKSKNSPKNIFEGFLYFPSMNIKKKNIKTIFN